MRRLLSRCKTSVSRFFWVLGQGVLKRLALDDEQNVTLFDILALAEGNRIAVLGFPLAADVHLVEVAADASAQIDAIDRLGAAGENLVVHNVILDRQTHHDFRRAGLIGLRLGMVTADDSSRQ